MTKMCFCGSCWFSVFATPFPDPNLDPVLTCK
jgi:hypothetical protein